MNRTDQVIAVRAMSLENSYLIEMMSRVKLSEVNFIQLQPTESAIVPDSAIMGYVPGRGVAFYIYREMNDEAESVGLIQLTPEELAKQHFRVEVRTLGA